MEHHTIVIGGGAAGLMAAAESAARGHATLLLEKNARPGVKILMSGGTRCNVTQATDNRGIVRAFGSQGPFLHSALAAFSTADTLSLFADEGVPTKIEPSGKVFPVSDKAADVLAALLARLRRCGAELALAEPVIAIERDGVAFRVVTGKRTLAALKVIVTTGGLSYPGSGTTGDGYAWCAAFGHTIVPTRPALTPLTIEAPWVRALSGITIPDVAIRVIAVDPTKPDDGVSVDGTNAKAGKARSARAKHDDDGMRGAARGSLLFTHFGLSGPPVLDVSRAVTLAPDIKPLWLECDFAPEVLRGSFDNLARAAMVGGGRKQLVHILPELLPPEVPKRVHEALLAQCALRGDRKAAEMNADERARFCQALRALRLKISGARGYGKAEVTSGGVALNEVDSRTMESKLAPGLYLAGEVLDLDGPIGGYNFQAAWSTGALAGRSG